ncbi:Inositol 2-dehydrogenase [Maioricimonas rarisocia]|uniref:Inositol 2-dehydrogenase n=1 Tax=Maioricimonas rarisocia TaxID=2528026 RepID=A0A517Z6D3_9PLAN|nr:Gfo/Idh/MocA family oxidoreductase [Maioricimonas rarisocia]QDU37981.1 Inositol 2-dehydrogenase [Maioricimonas rarisocia]
MPQQIPRRQFFSQSAAIGAGLYVAGQAASAESTSPNEKLNIGVIGPGGRGASNLAGVSGENIVAICDVDARRAAQAFEAFPKASRYEDFRKMLDNETLDAVVVSTPDHTHAYCSVTAMRQGLHCYCEKPLTRTVREARLVAQTAREHHVVTQMGTQIHATNNYRRVVEVIRSGAIGPVREVKVWVGKGWGGNTWPTDKPPIPEGVNWDLWLGPSAYRPYHPAYIPADWRRWWDFGGGTLADMGCHYIDLVFWALDLRHPLTCEAEGPPTHPETAPTGLKVTWTYPERGEQPPVTLTWTDGDMIEHVHDGHDLGGAGVYFVGDEGSMYANYGTYKLFPEDKFADFTPPEQTIPNSIGHHAEWIQACKTGEPTTCNFDYSGALTESVLLGTVAYRIGRKLEWDGAELKATNAPEAANVVWQPSRLGWEL